jgi:hypothetical protein
MSTQYRLVQSGKTASGGCSAGQGSSDPVEPRISLFSVCVLLLVQRLIFFLNIDLCYHIRLKKFLTASVV